MAEKSLQNIRIYVLTVTMATCFRHRMFIYTVYLYSTRRALVLVLGAVMSFRDMRIPALRSMPPERDVEMRSKPESFFFLPSSSGAGEEKKNFYELNVTHD
jgi:hypothetical protein